MADTFPNMEDPAQRPSSRASSRPGEAHNSDARGLPALQPVPVPSSSDERAHAHALPMPKGRAHFGPRLALVASDLAALTLCLSGALYLVHQKSPSTSWDSVLLANIVLSLPLLVVVGVSFALNNLYAKAPGQVLKSSFSELHDIIYGLGDRRLRGARRSTISSASLQRDATLEAGHNRHRLAVRGSSDPGCCVR